MGAAAPHNAHVSSGSGSSTVKRHKLESGAASKVVSRKLASFPNLNLNAIASQHSSDRDDEDEATLQDDSVAAGLLDRSQASLVELEAQERRRRKHNELEIRRRKRINLKFSELQNLMNCKSDRRGILQSAIDTIRSLAEKVSQLECDLEHMKTVVNRSQYHGAMTTGNQQAMISSIPRAMMAGSMGVPLDFHSIFRNMSAPMGFMSLDGRFIDCNTAMCVLLGRSREEILYTTMFGLANPKDLASIFSKIQRLIKGEQHSVVIDTYCVHSTGIQIPLVVLVFSVPHYQDIQNLVWIGVKTELSANPPVTTSYEK